MIYNMITNSISFYNGIILMLNLYSLKKALVILTIFCGLLNIINNTANAKELLIETIVQGSGELAKSGMRVSVHYTGKLSDGTVFDSSVERDQPFVFTLGQGEVIKGWDLGVEGMNIGESRQLTIPPELGYGASGAGDIIPPNSILIFDVKLLSVSWPPKLKNASPKQFSNAQKDGAIIIDIRRNEEWIETGIIEGAVTITAFTRKSQLHKDFQAQFMPLFIDKDAPIFIYCRTGNRTSMLGNALIDQAGFTNVTHLDEGIVGWKKNGFAISPYVE